MTGREIASDVDAIIDEIVSLRSELDAAVSRKRDLNREIAAEQSRINGLKSDADSLRQELRDIRSRRRRR